MSEVGSNYIFQAVTTIDFVFKKDKKYYPQVLLKECKYIEKKKQKDNLETWAVYTEICILP